MKKIFITMLILLCFVGTSFAGTSIGVLGKVSGSMSYYIPDGTCHPHRCIAKLIYTEYSNFEGIEVSGNISVIVSWSDSATSIEIMPERWEDVIYTGILEIIIDQDGTDDVIYHLTSNEYEPPEFAVYSHLGLRSYGYWTYSMYWHGNEIVSDTTINNEDCFFFLLF